MNDVAQPRQAESLTAAANLSPRYKWLALSNTTTGVLLATIDSSIMLIAMPDIFRGIGINPLQPGNTVYLLWMILGFQIVSSVLVVSLGRLGDMFGRVKMYNLGFVVFTIASLILTVDPFVGVAGAWWLILYPSLALFIVMLLGVFVGEGIREAYDPRPKTKFE